MPSLRRTTMVNRQSSIAAPGLPNANGNQKLPKCLEGMNVNIVRAVQNAPKHVSISYSACDHELLYETIVLFSATIAFFAQILHIYRTVWWLPQSYQSQAVVCQKFYLINPYLVCYVLSVIAPRWLWAIVKSLAADLSPGIHNLVKSSQLVLVFFLLMLHMYTVYLVVDNEDDEISFGTWFKLGCLLYPSFIIIVTWHENYGDYLDLVPSLHITSTNEDVQHSCTADPNEIRKEVKALTEDLNSRIKNVLFHSHIHAFVCGLIPCCLAQSSVYFDVALALQHFVFVWIGSLTLNAVRAFPPKYLDVLHSSAKHLGFWDRVEDYQSAQQAEEWNSSKVWQTGSLVRYNDEVYQAREFVNAGEPGCLRHKRFYSLFINSSLLYVTLLIIQLTLILTQMYLLCTSREWTQMISLSLLQTLNIYALFKLLRDTAIKWRVSLIEDML